MVSDNESGAPFTRNDKRSEILIKWDYSEEKSELL